MNEIQKKSEQLKRRQAEQAALTGKIKVRNCSTTINQSPSIRCVKFSD
jgi:hypothetical protein